jgi:hypothetical protein
MAKNQSQCFINRLSLSCASDRTTIKIREWVVVVMTTEHELICATQEAGRRYGYAQEMYLIKGGAFNAAERRVVALSKYSPQEQKTAAFQYLEAAERDYLAARDNFQKSAEALQQANTNLERFLADNST